jgi:alkylhydroperoxidase/carboxymuconolactone decarboxylase family protein YurZ
MTGESDLPPDLATRADEFLHTTRNAGQLAGMATEAFEASGLDHDTLVLVWLAALVALDAPTESYVLNLGAASQTAVSVERVHQVLTALAPIVGTARALSATSRITDVLSTGA